MCFFRAVFLPHLDIALCTIVKCTHPACYIIKSDMKCMNNCFIRCKIVFAIKYSMVKQLPMYIQATGLPNLSTGPIFLREFHSFLSTVFLPTQIPPDALMAPLTGSIITTSTQANLIIIHYVSLNGHQT